MKKIKKLATIMIIMVAAVLSTVSLNAQGLPGQTTLGISPDPDGFYRFSDLDHLDGIVTLSNVDNSYTSQVSSIREVMRWDLIGPERKGQKLVFAIKLMVYPGIDTLDISVKLNTITDPITGKKGNFALYKDQNRSEMFRNISLRGIENDVDSFIINTADGTWTPTFFNGNSGYYTKQWVITVADSVSDSQVDANNNFYLTHSVSFWSNKYPKKSPGATGPRIALHYTDGLNTWVGSYTYDGYMQKTKKIQARYDGKYVSYASTDYVSMDMSHYPTNFYDSTHCRKLVAKIFETKNKLFVSKKTIIPYWDQVDQFNVDSLRTDLVSFQQGYIADFQGLKDTTQYTVEWLYDDGDVETVVHRDTLWTKKLYTKPVFSDLILKSLNTNSVTVNLTFTRGNIDTFPIILRLLDNNGVVLPDFTVSTYGLGIYNTDIPLSPLISFKNYSIVAIQNGISLKTVPFKTLGIDAVINPSSLQTASVDVAPSVPLYTLAYTSGSIDSPGVARFIVTITDPANQQVAQYDKATVAGPITAQQIQIPFDFGVVNNTEYTVSLSQASYPTSANLVNTALGNFKFIKSSSSVSGIAHTNHYLYKDPSGMLHVKGLWSKTKKSIYDILGNKIAIFEETFDTKQLQKGMYFVEVDKDCLRFINE